METTKLQRAELIQANQLLPFRAPAVNSKPRKKDGRGRQPTFKPEERRIVAELIREHGARGAQRVSPIPICFATILRITKEFGIELKKGRRPKKAA